MASEDALGYDVVRGPIVGRIDVDALARWVIAASESTGRGRPLVLVDGRSGTGKTTLAAALAQRLEAQLVHLDDIYPGWDGLAAAAEAVVRDVLAGPDPATRRPGWLRWDWGTGLQTEWNELDPDVPLVVEGCGSLSRRAAPFATCRLWLEDDDEVRKRRALHRDGETFGRQWERWAEQELAFIRSERPRDLADLVLRLEASDC
jgi:uridine kinase